MICFLKTILKTIIDNLLSFIQIPVIKYLFATIISLVLSFYIGFKKFRKQQRSIAATKILDSVESCVDDLEEIKNSPGFYEYDGYYPNRIPETSKNEKPKRHPERPGRLIVNGIYELKKNIREPLIQISGKEYYKLKKMFSKIHKAGQGLANSIAAQNGNFTEDIKQVTGPHIAKYFEEIKETAKEIKLVLQKMVTG